MKSMKKLVLVGLVLLASVMVLVGCDTNAGDNPSKDSVPTQQPSGTEDVEKPRLEQPSSEAGEEKTPCAEGEHTGGTATCTAKAECTACGTAYGELNPDNHTSTEFTYIDNLDDTHAKVRKCCEVAENATEKHTFGENNKCSCGSVRKATITFDSDGGSAVAPITQECGTSVAVPENPTKTGFDFIGWSPSLPDTMPTEDITVKAMWQQTGYNIVWKAWNGSVIKTDYNVAKGTVPSYNGIPVKSSDGQYAYEFTGWTPEVQAVSGDATYTATYKAVPLSEIEYKVGDRVILTKSSIEYCSSCGILLKGYTARIVGVRGVLDGETVYWIIRDCCNHKTSIGATEIIGFA